MGTSKDVPFGNGDGKWKLDLGLWRGEIIDKPRITLIIRIVRHN